MRFTLNRFRVVPVFSRYFLLLTGILMPAVLATAEPLSKKTEIDFFRDVPSRNLKGLATRSDGRLVSGPTLQEMAGPAPADLLWNLEPTADPAKWLIGTGADGRIVEVTVDYAQPSYTSKTIVKLDDPQVFAVKALADGTILAGTSPRGGLYLIREDKPVARVALPVDSIFDLLLVNSTTALVATGNPGRIYQVDLAKFATVGLIADKITDTKILGDHGITLFGEIRDRNVRRIAALANGRIVAGSAPKGNVYSFAPAGGAPVILQENRDAEITDLLPQPNGDLFASIVYTSTTQESRITPPPGQTKGGAPAREEPPPPAQQERFSGRSAVIWFPANGFPETIAARANTAFYRLARRGDTLLMAGGEMGELAGFDLRVRLSLTFAGSISSQINQIAPIAGAPNRFLVLRNNAPGLALLDFDAAGPREAETRRIDLGTASQLGALRFNRLRNLTDANLALEIRASNGSDEVEGWAPWTALQPGPDSGWRSEDLRGRYVKLRLRVLNAAAAAATASALSSTAAPDAGSTPGKSATAKVAKTAKSVAPTKSNPAGTAPPVAAVIPATTENLAALEIDRATLFGLPQNRRPQLQDFRILAAGFSVIPAADSPPPATVSLSQLTQPPRDDERKRSNFMSSQVVPSPGTQVVLWNLADPDGDSLLSTFSIRRDGETNWTDVVVSAVENYAQFDTKHLSDGIYFTRLTATESAPRSVGERLTHTFETDDLVVDHTPPEIIEATARRTSESVAVSVQGRDTLSLLQGIELVFNNNVRESVEQPSDGVRDGREETFRFEIPLARVSNATAVEVMLYDAAGNGSARRLSW